LWVMVVRRSRIQNTNHNQSLSTKMEKKYYKHNKTWTKFSRLKETLMVTMASVIGITSKTSATQHYSSVSVIWSCLRFERFHLLHLTKLQFVDRKRK
jgi:hypothetical protein